ncbi:hypothetical protein VZT92_008136 [Zoarces viviparus]|uniref:Homeobox domain-containing protein n=1 Tax=Zoarces viviparus TaxID=48416 RepID=A0AAW1FMI1_ZOAVI
MSPVRGALSRRRCPAVGAFLLVGAEAEARRPQAAEPGAGAALRHVQQTRQRRLQISWSVDPRDRQVKAWFQNRRYDDEKAAVQLELCGITSKVYPDS